MYLGIDLGGTNIAAGVVDENMRMVARANRHTRVFCSDEDMTEQLAQTALEALANAGLRVDQVPWVGVGTPGSVDSAAGVVGFAGNLGLRAYPMAALLGKRLKARVLVENDANAAAYGEYVAGALRGARDAVAVTLGTGIGGGVLIDGRIYGGCNGAAGELGHTVIQMDGRPCTCGRRGCWETYASATGLIRTTRELMARAARDSALWRLAEGDPQKVSGRTAFDAMRAGDPFGQQAVDQYIRHLAAGLTNVINSFQPDILCIGGGICREGETLLAPLRKLVQEACFSVPGGKRTRICAAQLGNDAGIIGAAVLGRAAAPAPCGQPV